jgi:hypothetical protein
LNRNGYGKRRWILSTLSTPRWVDDGHILCKKIYEKNFCEIFWDGPIKACFARA